MVNIFNRSSRTEAIERCKDAEIVITNKFVVDEGFLSACPTVKFICVAATGYNNIDLPACKKRNILISNVSSYSTSSVTQHVFSLILHLFNKVGKHNKAVKKGYWSVCPDFSFTLHSIQELQGLNLGIFGYGQIGKSVAKVAKAFGMTVLAHSRSKVSGTDGEVTLVSKEELLKKSDILSLHAALNPESKFFINRANLQKMKSSAYIINTGRGELIHEMDLAEALERGEIAGAGIDVLSQEPAALSHPFYKLSNCIMTPHLAWASFQARERLMDGIIKNIEAYKAKQPINLII